MNFSLRVGGGTSSRQEANAFCVIVPILSGLMWSSLWFNQTFEQNITTVTSLGYSSRKVIFSVCVRKSYLLLVIRSWHWPDLTFTSPLLTDLSGSGSKSPLFWIIDRRNYKFMKENAFFFWNVVEGQFVFDHTHFNQFSHPVSTSEILELLR